MILLAVLTGLAIIIGIIILVIGLSGRSHIRAVPLSNSGRKAQEGSVKDCIIEGFFK